MHVALGRIRLKPGAGSFWRFLWYGALAYLQARSAAGNIYASGHRLDSRTHFSMSVWETHEAMLAYRNSGNHLRAMKVSRAFAAQIDFQHWQADEVPGWEAALRRFSEQADAYQK